MIQCNNLSKTFKSYRKDPGLKGTVTSFFKRNYIYKKAVEDFNLTVNKGEFVGFLGPNGAGKTTVMKMLTGIITPTSGTSHVGPHLSVERDMAFRKKISLVMGQKSQLWWDIPAMDSFLLMKKYYEISDKNFDDRIKYLGEVLDVKKLFHIHVRKLSLGERMKLELMACLLHNPEVIFLDEPTIGLDFMAQRNIRQFLLDYHKETNSTILLTSHYMADIEKLCDRIVLILNGKKKYDGSIKKFQNTLGNEKLVTFVFSKPVDSKESFWNSFPCDWEEDQQKVEFQLNEDKFKETCIHILQNYPVSDFYTEKTPIESVMSKIYQNPDLLKDPS